MDTLHTVLRAIRGEAPPRRDHLHVFREFLGHLDRASKRGPRKTATPRTKRMTRKSKR
ncbi:MAG: hypothetical protein AB7O60_05340 [Variibacter sp.]